MSRLFDPGYGDEPFKTLVEDYSGPDVYPPADFRVEWGPVFHRGRLDGSARVLILGQDPAQNETVVRRILVGEAGQRVQGFMAKLGITRSYVLVNTFLYSVYGQGGGNRHRNNAAIAGYRNRWLDALLVGRRVEAVVALGLLADVAWQAWRGTPRGQQNQAAYAKITHPTQPESSSKGDRAKHREATKVMLQNWNAALQLLKPAVAHPDVPGPLALYGDAFQPDDKRDIPDFDLPAGLPAWMGTQDNWARRVGATPRAKRANITLTVPKAALP